MIFPSIPRYTGPPGCLAPTTTDDLPHRSSPIANSLSLKRTSSIQIQMITEHMPGIHMPGIHITNLTMTGGVLLYLVSDHTRSQLSALIDKNSPTDAPDPALSTSDQRPCWSLRGVPELLVCVMRDSQPAVLAASGVSPLSFMYRLMAAVHARSELNRLQSGWHVRHIINKNHRVLESH